MRVEMPYPCCGHCQHPEHPQFTGHASPCCRCELERLAAHLAEHGDLDGWNEGVQA